MRTSISATGAPRPGWCAVRRQACSPSVALRARPAGRLSPCWRAWRLLQPSRMLPQAIAVPESGSIPDHVMSINTLALKVLCKDLTKQWLGVDAAPEMSTQSYAIKGKQDWSLLVSGAAVRSGDGSPCVVVCLAARCPGLASVGELSDLLVHWGCSKGPGKSWRPPPAGWHTMPPVSYDAGHGAWQTAFKPVAPNDPVHMALIQLPFEDVLREGGLSFVLKSDSHWLQNKDNSNGKDFFFSVAELLSSSAAPVMQMAAPEAPAPPPPPPVHQEEPSFFAAPPPVRQEEPSFVAAPQDPKPKERYAVPPPQPKAEPPPQAEADSNENDSSPWATAASLLGGVNEAKVRAYIDAFQPDGKAWSQLLDELHDNPANTQPSNHVCGWMIDKIGHMEHECERSLMHRFSTCQQLVDDAAGSDDPQGALAAILVWLRLSAARHLTWNRNYNVKPREISAAQERLNTSYSRAFGSLPWLRHIVVPSMAAAGRGGSSDVGQRVRDDILAVQSRNHCKGGMMEEWHQKLHNNTSPDDVVICQALIAMLEEGLDIKAYWRTLHESGITAERLASYDRSIRSEPKFSPEQVPGLLADLRWYLQTLQAVHSGADLGSAAGSVLGFSQRSMKGKLVTVDPVPGVSSPELREMLLAVLYQQHRVASAVAGDNEVSDSDSSGSMRAERGDPIEEASLMLQLVLQARHHLRPIIRSGDSGCGGRLYDVLFLDMALDTAARTSLETIMAHVREAAHTPASPGDKGPPAALVSALWLVRWAVENAALSAEQVGQVNVCEDLSKATKWLSPLTTSAASLPSREWAMQASAVLDRLKRSLSDNAYHVIEWLRPTALALGDRLGVPHDASCLMCEDAARGTAIAPVAQLLAAVEPGVRQLGGQGSWQIISRGNDTPEPVSGRVRVEATLEQVQYETCAEPTILVVDFLSGNEEVPEGTVAVLTSGDCPDVLSHSAVRARNMGVVLAACFNDDTSGSIKSMAGAWANVSLVGSEVIINAAE